MQVQVGTSKSNIGERREEKNVQIHRLISFSTHQITRLITCFTFDECILISSASDHTFDAFQSWYVYVCRCASLVLCIGFYVWCIVRGELISLIFQVILSMKTRLLRSIDLCWMMWRGAILTKSVSRSQKTVNTIFGHARSLF